MPIKQGIIQTVLGNGQEGWGGDGGPAIQAACETPYMCAFDTQGNMFVCMGRHHRIRRMDAKAGMITLSRATTAPAAGRPAADLGARLQPNGAALEEEQTAGDPPALFPDV
jgi:hypothetical protein